MNAIYCSNLSEFDRQMTYLEKAFEADFQEAMLALEMVNQRLDINCLKAEARVILESGTDEDLSYLYNEAAAEAKANEGGLFKNIINKLTTFINNVWTSFTNLFRRQKPEQIQENMGNDSIELGFDVKSIQSVYQEFIANMGSKEQLTEFLKTAGILVGGTISVAGITAYLKKKSGKRVIVDKNNVVEVIDENTKVKDSLIGLTKLLDKITDNDIFKKASSCVKHIISCCEENIKKLSSKVFNNNGTTNQNNSKKDAEIDARTQQLLKQKEKEAKEQAKKEYAKKETTMKNQVMGVSRDAYDDDDEFNDYDVHNSSVQDTDPLDGLDTAMMESASLEELEALIDNL